MAYLDTTARIGRKARRGLIPSLLSLVALARQRRALATLDDDRLADLGISAQAAKTEASRPIWDVPSNWRQ